MTVGQALENALSLLEEEDYQEGATYRDLRLSIARLAGLPYKVLEIEIWPEVAE